MTKLKFCGLRREEDYKKALELQADFTGFIFYQKSPRYIAPKKAAAWAGSYGKKHALVGVFVNASLREIHEIKDQVGLDIIQLHGTESPEFCQALGLPYWKVIHIADRVDPGCISFYDTDTFLLDKKKKGIYGGTGENFQWESIRLIPRDKKIIIAGGLRLDNLDRALMTAPYAVDINSGVESSPGIKDHALMEKAVERIKNFTVLKK